ncbi:RNA-splicing factor [Arachnomyces sp. PD_36]|nr:RNA-splicing factor [Arachnomyces sp. PD_36]
MEGTQAAEGAPPVVFKKRAAKSKSSFRKRESTPPKASSSDSDYSSEDDEEGKRIKRRRKNVAVTASSASASKGRVNETEGATESTPLPLASSNDATKQSNWYDEGKEDDLSAKNLLGNTRARPDAVSGSDGTYKGAANYQSFIQKNPNAAQKQVGPMKAPTNIRTITVMDYAPDVCKDYKQTGYCGFGDSCKFLHDRSNVQQGWELDRSWEIGTKGKKIAGKAVASRNRDLKNDDDDEDEDDSLLESIPFACVICKKPYKNPIITKCGHYFCESCALQRYRKNPSCMICGAGTGGVFNVAKKLTQLLDKKRERARKRREKAIEDGEEPSEDEEEGISNGDSS